MNTTLRIFHQLRNDLRRHQLLFVLLGIGLCAFAAIDYWLLFHPQRGFPSELVVMAVFGLGVLMAALIIHADPPTGTSSFWKTRPLRGLEMFFSKAIEVLLVALLLFAGWNAAPVFSGAPAAQLWSFQAILPPLLFGVMAVAAVSKNLFQAALVGVVLWAGVATIAWLSEFTHNHSAFEKTAAMRSTGTLLAGMLLAIGAFLITLYQYLRTRQAIGIFALALVLVLGFLVMQRSTADLLTKWISPSEQRALGLNNVEIHIDPNPETFQRGSHTLHTATSVFEYYQLSGKAKAEQLPEGVYVSMISASGELRNSETGEILPALSGANQSRPHAILGRLISHDYTVLDRSSTASYQADRSLPFLKFPQSDYATIAAQDWRYKGVASALLARLDPVQTIAFGEETVLRRPGWSGRITSTLGEGQRIEVHLHTVMWNGGNHERRPAFACLVVNRQRNEALSATGGGGGSSSNRRRAVDSSWSFNRKYWAAGKQVSIADDWLENAEVILYQEKFLGTIQRPVTLDPLILPDLNPHQTMNHGS